MTSNHQRSKGQKLTRRYRGFVLSGYLDEPSVLVTDSNGVLIDETRSFKDAMHAVDAYISGNVEY